jgi:PAS domain S-box-containing protein
VIFDLDHSVFELKTNYSAELTKYKKTGETFKAAIDVTSYLNKNGELERYFIVGRDITETVNYQRQIKNQRDLAILKKDILANTIVKLKESQEEIQKKNFELEQLSHVVSNIDNAVMIISPEGEIEWVNEGFTKLYGFSYEEFTESGTNLFDVSTNPKMIKPLKRAINRKKALSYDIDVTTKSNKSIWVRTTWTPVFDEVGNLTKLIGVDTDISKQKSAEEKLKHINKVFINNSKLIKDSIRNAKRIQDAMLPSEEFIRSQFNEIFVLYKPKEIISGDFYWFEIVNDMHFVAVADCTGHGVPGALLSVLCSNALTKVVKEYGVHIPSKILDKTAELLHDSFSQSDDNIKDGMDIALCCFHRDKRILEYAGANNSLYHVTQGELIEIKADKQPIGYFRNRKPFTNNSIQIKKGDCFYLYSDGYADQFGGKHYKKFYYKPFKELLLKNHSKHMAKQKQLLNDEFNHWKGNTMQIDDVCVIGFRIDE